MPYCIGTQATFFWGHSPAHLPFASILVAVGWDGLVEEYGYAGAARDLLTQNAVAAAVRAQRMSIRYTQWTGAMARIMHAMAVLVYLGPLVPRAAPWFPL